MDVYSHSLRRALRSESRRRREERLEGTWSLRGLARGLLGSVATACTSLWPGRLDASDRGRPPRT